LLRKQQKTLGGYFFLPHPVGMFSMFGQMGGAHRKGTTSQTMLVSSATFFQPVDRVMACCVM